MRPICETTILLSFGLNLDSARQNLKLAMMMMMMKNEARGCAKLRPEQLSAEMYTHLSSNPYMLINSQLYNNS